MPIARKMGDFVAIAMPNGSIIAGRRAMEMMSYADVIIAIL
jgi:hypothetical protein